MIDNIPLDHTESLPIDEGDDEEPRSIINPVAEVSPTVEQLQAQIDISA